MLRRGKLQFQLKHNLRLNELPGAHGARTENSARNVMANLGSKGTRQF